MESRLTIKEVREYLARIHYTGPIEPTIEALSELQRRHVLTVPWENLSVIGKEQIILSKDWLFNKIVRRHRGGICFELNTMFSFLLDYFGFNYNTHAATTFSRVNGQISAPFDHRLLMVDIGDELWLTDVGFGDAFWTPLRFRGLGEHQEQTSGTYRIREDGDDDYFYEERVKTNVDELGREAMAKEHFSTPGDPNWVPRYKFDLIPRKTEDFLKMLTYHQTCPSARFNHGLICSLAKPWGRVTLSGSKLVTTKYLGDNKVKKETRELVGGEEEVVKELEEKFGIRRDTGFYPERCMEQ